MMFLWMIIYISAILSAAGVVLSTQGAAAAAIMSDAADPPSAAATAHAALDGTANNSNGSGTSSSRLTCAQSMVSVDHLTDDGDITSTDAVTQMPYVTCEDESKYCFALWHEMINGTTTIVMMGQGCWETSGKPDNCERSECVNDRKPTGDVNATKFCCCSGDMCNANVTNAYGPNYVEEIIPQNDSVVPCPVSNKNVPYYIFFIGLAASVPFCMLLIVCTCWFHKKKKKTDVELGTHDNDGNAITPGILLPAHYNLEKLKLTDIVIGEGRYGRVLKASLGSGDNQRDVAVKVFPADHRNYYHNEYDLYEVAGEHPHLVRCFGKRDRAMVELTAALEATAKNQLQYMLVLSLEQESLMEFLSRETFDLTALCRMTLGIAKGLAHLHCDLGKQCIAHRDLNTKNILVTSDLNCRICDLGLAVVPRRTENKVLSEAGTLRYMAPEVLEGAVNLRDCESALRQIDVYALGLVLWEVGTRCGELQGGVEPEPYAPPFHRELRGITPSLEQMQTLVTKHKARPLWPVTWADGTSAAAHLLRETTEDCWDQDAEARLTSLCVEERLLELPSLRGRGVGAFGGHPHVILASPAALINNNHLYDQHEQHNNSNSVSANSVTGSGDGGGSTTHIGSLTTIEASVSVGTVDTLLSPSGEDNNCKNSNMIHDASMLPYGNGGAGLQQYYMNRLTAPPNHDNYIQPYQGRNPCMERNLHSESSDSPLIDKSAKHSTNSETQNLLTNGFLNAMNQRNPRAMPIPYLQNAVHATSDNQPHNRSAKQNSMAASAKTNKFINFRGLKKLFHTKKDQGNLSLLKDTQVRMIPAKLVNSNYGQNGVTTSLLKHEENNSAARRPTTLTLSCNGEAKPTSAGVSQLLRAEHSDKGVNIENNLSRQRSLEQFSEVFTSVLDLSRLKDPSARVKTPGDVPASVRRTRGKAAKQSVTRFSLYDDRMMTQWGSAPDLEPPMAAGSTATTIATVSARTAQAALETPMLGNIQVRDSVTSF